MVNPGGTGSAALVISARPAPLPPSRSFISPRPSALPFAKRYTYLVAIRISRLESDALDSLLRTDHKSQTNRIMDSGVDCQARGSGQERPTLKQSLKSSPASSMQARDHPTESHRQELHLCVFPCSTSATRSLD